MKRILVTFPNGDMFAIPAEVVAHNRTKYYYYYGHDEYQNEFEYAMGDDLELKDWLVNNMDWKDVKDHAVLVDQYKPKNYDEMWSEAKIGIDYEN